MVRGVLKLKGLIPLGKVRRGVDGGMKTRGKVLVRADGAVVRFGETNN